LGAAGVFAAKSATAKGEAGYSLPNNEKYINRTLGNTGIKLPIVSLGVMRVDNPKLVTASLNAGLVHLDSAHVYQGGRNEEMLGELLKDYDRNSFVISSKILTRDVNTSEEFIKKFETSLDRLQMDYVDILYLHASSSRDHTLDERWLEALKKLKKNGKTRFVGVSTHKNEPEVLRAAVESNFYDVVLTAYNYRMDHLTDVKAAIAEAANAGLGIIAMKTMAGVYLDKEKTKKINTKAALKWALQDENVHTSIPGCTAFEHLEENLEVAQNLEFTEEEKQDLKETSKQLSMFCTGCSECEPQCPYNVPVPELMRAYMYAYGYKDLALSKQVLNDLNIGDDVCQNCNECLVQCPDGFNVAEKTKDIIRLKQVPDDLLV
jgi:hypothetical protein